MSLSGTLVYNPSNANLKTFPMLGAFEGEVGSGHSAGGISNIGSTWTNGMPLSYWWNYGRIKGSKKKAARSPKRTTSGKNCKTNFSKKSRRTKKKVPSRRTKKKTSRT